MHMCNEKSSKLPLIRWVTPKGAEVDRFRDLYKTLSGIELSADEAWDLAIRCVHIHQFLSHAAEETEPPSLGGDEEFHASGSEHL